MPVMASHDDAAQLRQKAQRVRDIALGVAHTKAGDFLLRYAELLEHDAEELEAAAVEKRGANIVYLRTKKELA